MMSATALRPASEKARSSERATVDNINPGWSGVTTPMVPVSRTTGTTGTSERKRAGSNERTASRRPASIWRKCSDMLGWRRVPCSAMVLFQRSSTSTRVKILPRVRPIAAA